MRPPAVVVPFLTAVLVLSGCSGSDDGGAGAPVGTLIEASGDVEGAATFVELPVGRVDFTIAQPRAHVSNYTETYDHAADGASLVGVGWEWDFLTAVPGMLDPTQPEPEPRISLVADGRDYPLDRAVLNRYDEDRLSSNPSVLQFDGGVYVAVEGTPHDLQIKVDYDGLTQVVDPDDSTTLRDSDSASPLYRNQTELAALPVPCGAPVTPKATRLSLSGPYCRVEVARLPYVQGAGWEPTGDGWVVVDVTASGGAAATWGSRGMQAVYTVEERGPVTYQVDGVEPVRTITGASDDSPDRLVFPASAAGGRLGIDTSFATTGTLRIDGAPDDPTVPARWTVELS